MEKPTSFILKIFRGNPENQYWEEFELPYDSSDNIISALMDIQKNPLNKQGIKVQPVVWEQGCLEEVCGSCSMLINGKPRQACTALISNLIGETGSRIITLAPFTKFPLVRDLIVDRGQMFDNLKKVHAWIEVDGYFDRGPGPKIDPKVQDVRYSLSTCMTCGCCVEACPQINKHSNYVGPQIISQVRLFNSHPTGKMQRSERLRPLMEKGGISEFYCSHRKGCDVASLARYIQLAGSGTMSLCLTPDFSFYYCFSSLSKPAPSFGLFHQII
jgi:succinate dehydrogenase / fumarate reductase iron-sulfur subunit